MSGTSTHPVATSVAAQHPGNAASADDYADWTAAIEACATIDALKACKKEMVDAFKGVTNVPAVLTKTYNERLNALRAPK